MSSPSRVPPSDDLTPYERFYGLRARPFSLTPDLRFAYHSRSHDRALTQVSDALRHREGLIIITGEIGTGKTMLCRTLLEGFTEARTFLSVILNPFLSADDLLFQVLADFGLTDHAARPARGPVAEATRHELVTTLQHFLASLIPLNAHAVIMVDEAQHLDAAVLEQLRLLSNFETDEAKLLQIVLVGQPNLDEVLARPEMRQLSQRIARRFELQPLAGHEVQDYITRRLAVAAQGGTQPSADAAELDAHVHFTPTAVDRIATISSGIPRVVNTLCDRSLEVGFERQTRLIDDSIVTDAAQRLKLLGPSVPPALLDSREPIVAHDFEPVGSAPTAKATQAPLAVAAVLLIALIAGGLWWATRPAAPAAAPAPQTSAPVSRPAPAPAAPPPAAAPPTASPSSTTTPAASTPPASANGAATPPATGRGAAGSYGVTVASFRTAKRANDVSAEIVAKGFRASTRTDSSGTWFMVVVGPFATADEAANAQRALAREGYPDSRVSAPTPPEPR